MKTGDTAALLADYARTGSEPAFRELVARYVDLVYSAAVRLVGNDAELARDVAQIVFVDLARKAPRLAPDVMLGGWLHRHTVFVASTVRRGERRRQARERQVVEMNAHPDHTQENLARLAPVLDEAINQLGTQDRQAILLRFFEQREFPAVAAALGASEDAARKRVARALEKLRIILPGRGVSLSAAALAAALAGGAVTAAPAGLAASLAATAAGCAVGGKALTVLGMTAMTKLKISLAGALAAGALITPIVLQHQALQREQEIQRGLREQLAQTADLEAENTRLSNLVARAQSPPTPASDQLRELLRLRGEVGMLRSQSNQLAGLREENRRLKASAAAPRTSAAAADQSEEEHQLAIAKLNDARRLGLGIFMFANDNAQKTIERLEQLEPYLGNDAAAITGTNRWELLFHGSLQDIPSAATTILAREAQGWQTADGLWHNLYVFADGHAEVQQTPDGDFSTFTRQHVLPPQTQTQPQPR